ncbi:hypothetical protein [Superficieibacter sp. 1612_C1]|uniref:hypothetical protein n=1 Tax=Superficieibacter sp. 1612_C1 TaxID=2780382 RepID=UPI001884289F|nr:hypothetical protein [Superficieibacter sp. 1612_C1]
MIRVKLNQTIYDIGYGNGLYFARASFGDSPFGRTLEELAEGLSQCTGLKKEDIIEYLSEQFSD